MGRYLGIDTSNYTTSTAIYDSGSGEVVMSKRLLPVAEGSVGLRQSDAVFAHVKQLGELMQILFSKSPGPLDGIGVSAFPRRAAGSYMPCFLVGEMAAESLAAAHAIPLARFSHQEGHVMAALYSAGRLDLQEKRFLAFHLSGGTTDALLVEPDEPVFRIEKVAGSLDLKAGQAVDRVGVMLGLPFPCGPALTELALSCSEEIRVRPVIKGEDCCLSGIENQCKKLLSDGCFPGYVAKFCILSIAAALDAMTEALLLKYGKLPLLYAGGVMSNVLIRERMEQKYGGIFAEPQYSSDNSAGIAILAAFSKGNNK